MRSVQGDFEHKKRHYSPSDRQVSRATRGEQRLHKPSSNSWELIWTGLDERLHDEAYDYKICNVLPASMFKSEHRIDWTNTDRFHAEDL
ncbi:MAG: hypothetical protein AUH08_13340 [Verrucomicrobia bacterium 13_2_20CM_54_12]|nr:MAG: hypothetical protein AUH08_13340 [Verrucomicrobia bacterium 13_2_20CM_54_12]OLB42554.1 MAG: hypothetical protein AUI00_05695 [Verrucomicrobia bacterium 13_2_20CM_2_54_15]OLD87392.1 MAG: hypothetical protein AUG81_09205 [Verrucomicrobia bacterium 13_1_20CM_4_54_11]OLE12858.1 MAG: hypothetical protein AUG52_02510 [Verrucomicrobia bacterium 13_1_20CM_3_54_17]PYK16101.1 MAG: hypothetical protein DME64_04185 [Verrucomicrobiota bacterium]